MSALTLTPAARDWVLKHGGVLTIRAAPQHGCCGGHAAVPVAEPRTPDGIDGFDRLQVDGVTVYLSRALDDGPYRIDLEGLWRWHRLAVEGAVSPWRGA